jgi:hypothetical protein
VVRSPGDRQDRAAVEARSGARGADASSVGRLPARARGARFAGAVGAPGVAGALRAPGAAGSGHDFGRVQVLADPPAATAVDRGFDGTAGGGTRLAQVPTEGEVIAGSGTASPSDPLATGVEQRAADHTGDLSLADAVAASYALPEVVQRGLTDDARRQRLLELGSQFFGSYRATLDHFAAIRVTDSSVVPGGPALHDAAARRFERACSEFTGETGLACPRGHGFQLRSSTWEDEFAFSASTGHPLGFALDFDAVDNPHVRLSDRYGPSLALLVEVVTEGSHHADLGDYSRRRRLIRELALTKASSADARTLIDEVVAEVTRLGAASRSLQDSLGEGNGQLQDLRTWYFEAETDDEREEVVSLLPAVVAPWTAMIDARIDDVAAGLAELGLDPVVAPAASELGQVRRDLARIVERADRALDALDDVDGTELEERLAGWAAELGIATAGSVEERLTAITNAAAEQRGSGDAERTRLGALADEARVLRRSSDRGEGALARLAAWEAELGLAAGGGDFEDRACAVQQAAGVRRASLRGRGSALRDVEGAAADLLADRLGRLPAWEAAVGLPGAGSLRERLTAVRDRAEDQRLALAWPGLADTLAQLEALRLLRAQLVGDARFVFGREDRDAPGTTRAVAATPSVVQLVERGFFSAGADEAATFHPAFLEALVRNGFDLGLAWSSPDFMHVELAVEYTRPAEP